MNTNYLNFSLLHQSVEHQAIHNPRKVAIDEGARAITYAELCSEMHRIASVLQTNGTLKNDRIGLLTGSGIEACAGMLGILRADACYVPLNPAFPEKRLGSIIVDAGIKSLVTVKKYSDQLLKILKEIDGFQGVSIILLDSPMTGPEGLDLQKKFFQYFTTIIAADTLSQVAPPKPTQAMQDDLAYVMYTSGTTGTPNGVMVTHQNVTSFLRWALDHFSISSCDRMSGHSDISFDLSVFDIFGSFFAGATLCPVTHIGDKSFPGKFINDREITIWFSVPSVIGTLRKSGQLTQNIFSKHLRWAIFCGEALLPDYAESWIKTHPTVPMCNLYGPTEATIACSYFNLGDERFIESGNAIPIGHPTADTEIQILKQQTDEVADVDEIGRLMISGAQLSPGYFGKPGLTQDKFIPHPFKNDTGERIYDSSDLAYRDGGGLIHFVGRADSQVKIMGYRVELGEIETVIAHHIAVNEAAVVLMKTEKSPLVAAVSLNQGFSEDTIKEDILIHCEQYLPSYMVPQHLVIYPSLPKNNNGKIDRNAITYSNTDLS
jgi:amino acid adenylation domain-containing protein